MSPLSEEQRIRRKQSRDKWRLNHPEYRKQYGALHREELNAKERERQHKKKEYLRLYHKDYYQKHKDKLLEKSRKYYKQMMMDKIRREQHRLRANKNSKRRREQNPEKYKESQNRYRFKRQEKNKEQKKALKLEIIRAYGGKCQCPGGCDVVEPEFLTIDHIDGKGQIFRGSNGRKNGGFIVYKWLKKNNFPKDHYRLLCMNCNFAIRLGDKCPHEKNPKRRGHAIKT